MTDLTCIIVDDERLARTELRATLTELGGCRILGEAASAMEAATLLGGVDPDCIFLDVTMPERGGFAFLDGLENPPPIVFVTAHDNFAVRAFSVRAVDYLLKPVAPERLAETLKLLRERTFGKTKPGEVIEVETHCGLKLLDLALVDLLRSYDHYVRLYHRDGTYLVRRPLRDIEPTLPGPSNFFRCNRSEIVRRSAIVRSETQSRSRYLFILANGETIKVSEARSRVWRALPPLQTYTP